MNKRKKLVEVTKPHVPWINQARGKNMRSTRESSATVWDLRVSRFDQGAGEVAM